MSRALDVLKQERATVSADLARLSTEHRETIEAGIRARRIVSDKEREAATLDEAIELLERDERTKGVWEK